MVEKSSIRIIIVSWNNKATLQNCLESVKKAGSAFLSSVILVDNHSTDGGILPVKKLFPEILAIENSENLGFSKAVNQGLQKSDTKYILLLNPDTQIFPDTIPRLVEFLEREPQVGIVGPKVMAPDHTPELSFGPFPNPWSEFVQRKRYYQLERKETGILKWMEEQAKIPQDVDWVSGVCLVIRREVVEKIGFLDDRFFMYFEDIDYCYRARDAGWRICYDPSTQILHDRGTSMRQNRERIKAEYRRSKKYYYEKHCDLISRAIVSVWNTYQSG